MNPIKYICLVTLVIATSFGCDTQTSEATEQIGPNELKTTIETEEDIVLVDVRTPEEYEAGTIGGAENINFHDEDFKTQFAKFDKEEPIYIFCQSGNRSGKTAKILADMGFKEIYDLKGGYLAWEK